jgi:hypothetical protein
MLSSPRLSASLAMSSRRAGATVTNVSFDLYGHPKLGIEPYPPWRETVHRNSFVPKHVPVSIRKFQVRYLTTSMPSRGSLRSMYSYWSIVFYGCDVVGLAQIVYGDSRNLLGQLNVINPTLWNFNEYDTRLIIRQLGRIAQ